MKDRIYVCGLTYVIPTLRRERKEDYYTSEAGLGYTVSSKIPFIVRLYISALPHHEKKRKGQINKKQ